MPLFECRAEINGSAIADVDAAVVASGAVEWSVYEDVLAGRAWLIGIFSGNPAARVGWRNLRSVLPRRGIRRPVWRELAEVDWRESYKAHFKAWRCGPLHWVPEWERTTHPVPRGEAAVYLDPGLAFGTGNHETTRLCCRRLVEYARALSPRSRCTWRVVDAGCGSGILAISAAKLGCRRIHCFDLDAEATAITRDNARRNRVAAVLRVGTGGLEDQLACRSADLVLANIQADVLMANAAVLLRAVAPGGHLVLSGILAGELAEVRRAFEAAAGWQAKVSSRRLGEWADLRVLLPRGKEKGGPQWAASKKESRRSQLRS